MKKEHRDYEYMFWTDKTIREFMDAHYHWFIPTFDSYRYPIQRVDAFRYFVLYHFGGIYVDLDIGARQSLDLILPYGLVLPITKPFGFSNDLMAVRPRHPFMELLMRKLVSANRNYLVPYLTVMASTGPLFMSSQYHWADKEQIADAVAMDGSLYGGQRGLIFHVDGSSWHEQDAKYILWLWDNFCPLFLLKYTMLLAALVAVIVFRLKYIDRIQR